MREGVRKAGDHFRHLGGPHTRFWLLWGHKVGEGLLAGRPHLHTQSPYYRAKCTLSRLIAISRWRRVTSSSSLANVSRSSTWEFWPWFCFSAAADLNARRPISSTRKGSPITLAEKSWKETKYSLEYKKKKFYILRKLLSVAQTLGSSPGSATYKLWDLGQFIQFSCLLASSSVKYR